MRRRSGKHGRRRSGKHGSLPPKRISCLQVVMRGQPITFILDGLDWISERHVGAGSEWCSELRLEVACGSSISRSSE
eukprot:scaffold1676_cov323-Pinguiococcus_pyrenoidosus.AAC.2